MKSQTLAAVAILLTAILIIGCTRPGGVALPGVPNPKPSVGEAGDLKSFSSWNEISDFLASTGSSGYYGGYYGRGMVDSFPAMMPLANVKSGAAETSGTGQAATDYSSTNVQVEGVDEADIVKNDGKYIYAVPQSGSSYYGGYGGSSGSKIIILDAYPAAGMEVVSEISVEGSVQEIFAYKDKLVAFGSEYQHSYERQCFETNADCQNCVSSCIPSYGVNFGFMKIYDISNRSKPKLEKTIESKGNYVQSRMINGKVYAIFQDAANRQYPMPLYLVDGEVREVQPADVKYFDWPDDSYNFDSFIGVDLDNLEKQESRKFVLMGYSQNIYVSQDNMYITYTRYNSYPVLYEPYEEVYGSLFDSETRQKIAAIDSSNVSDWRKERLKVSAAQSFVQKYASGESSGFIEQATAMMLRSQFSERMQKIQQQPWQENERTVINKIALDGKFTYVAKGEVPGHALNQFSMDESGGNFRIATTVGQVSRMIALGQEASSNNVYVLDDSLEIVGRLEGLAKGEKIYSSRFMGNRLYLVTFKKVDPFFVIDLADAKNPKMLGKLKIPGYSDYLHIYDEDHVIGLGKGAVAAEEGDFAWYQGVKLSLFDVSDVAHPTEVAKYEIGDRGTDSYALSDHKAFLFSKSKNLLVIPITLAEIDEGKYASGVQANTYGDFTFQGAYVFSITPEDGFKLRGRITHADSDELAKSGEYYWSGSNVKRSLYMGNYLYTVSDRYVKANSLDSLQEISMVDIGQETVPPVLYD